MEKFLNNVIPRHFRSTSLTSFTRNLNYYGFKKIRRFYTFAWCHPQFKQSHIESIKKLKRPKLKSKKVAKVVKTTKTMELLELLNTS